MHGVLIVVGVAALLVILKSMVHVALLNRHDIDFLAASVARTAYKLIVLQVRSARHQRDGQATLRWLFGEYFLGLIGTYFVGAWLAFACIYWGVGAVKGWHQALIAAGSGLTTLGFATPTTNAGQWVTIPEGALGLGIIVYLFTFIPGVQAAISSRDIQTAWLYARLSNRANVLTWFEQFGRPQNLDDIWDIWEGWFRQLYYSHGNSPILAVVPSGRKGQSWIVAAAVVLDAASFSISTLASEPSESARTCLRSGSQTMEMIAEFDWKRGKIHSVPSRSTLRKAYDGLCEQITRMGVPLKPDRETSWLEFIELRSRYAYSVLYLGERAFVHTADTLGEPLSSGTA